jgi:hypothetical protein
MAPIVEITGLLVRFLRLVENVDQVCPNSSARPHTRVYIYNISPYMRLVAG